MYVGYDSGDLFYDDQARLRMLNKWFRRNVARPCRIKEVLVKGVFLNFTNVLRKPGPVFNFAAAAAIHDGVVVRLWVCLLVCQLADYWRVCVSNLQTTSVQRPAHQLYMYVYV